METLLEKIQNLKNDFNWNPETVLLLLRLDILKLWDMADFQNELDAYQNCISLIDECLIDCEPANKRIQEHQNKTFYYKEK